MKTLPFTRIPVAVAALLGAALLMPLGAAAQAICSAPHSSPTLVESGTNRTLPQGQGWVQVSTSINRAERGFNPNGDRQDFIGGSVFHTRSLYFTASYGVIEGLEVWGQLPVHWLEADASNGSSVKKGLGDLRAAVRVSPAILGYEAPVALRFGFKQPGQTFPVDATELPLSEGQRDYEVSVESGISPTWLPVHVSGWVGYRWRETDHDREHDPGNETFAHLSLGRQFTDVFALQLGFDALWGETPYDQGLELRRQSRQLYQVSPTLSFVTGPGTLQATIPIPIAGENLPAGYGASVGYQIGWGR